MTSPRKSLTPGEATQLRRTRMATSRTALPGWRSLQGCGRRLIDRKQGVTVIANKAQLAGATSIRFCGVSRCGGVWICPECAAAVTETRARELTSGVTVWTTAGNTVVMCTLTFSHTASDGLKDLMTRLRNAMKDLKAHRTYKRARQDLGVHGSVRALEVTVGDVNGWHPHVHQLEFIRGKPTAAQLDAFRAAILPVWQSVCEANDLGRPSDDRGIDLTTGKTVHERIAAYVAKWGTEPVKVWGAERELTKCHTKTAKVTAKGGTRYHPFALLDALHETGESIFLRWYLEYATAFKGQRQLVWSRGLKATLRDLGMTADERTDQEIAEQGDGQPGDEIVAVIPPRDWVLLCRHRLIEPMTDALIRSPHAFVINGYIEKARSLQVARLGRDRWRFAA